MSENQYLEQIRDLFVELRYFDKSDMVEKKRELGALLAIYWIVTNQHEQFVRGQAEGARLTKESWEKLQAWTQGTVKLTSGIANLRAMLVFAAIMSVGKIKAFRTAFVPECQEFSEALIKVLQNVPTAFPSYARLDPHSRQMILSSLQAGDFNFGQFLQAENLPANMSVVKDISQGEGSILGFFLFKLFAAMCGILGMKSLEGSLFMADKMYGNFKTGLDVLGYLNSEPSQQVYNRFLAERAKGQGLLFDPNDVESRAIVRLASMTRIFDSEGGTKVKTALNTLDAAQRSRLIGYLNADGIAVKPGFLLYNAPNLLGNGMGNQKIGLPHSVRMLLKVYDLAAHEYEGSKSQVVTIMVDELAAVAQKETDPEVFALTDFEISRAAGVRGETQGIVSIKD